MSMWALVFSIYSVLICQVATYKKMYLSAEEVHFTFHIKICYCCALPTSNERPALMLNFI